MPGGRPVFLRVLYEVFCSRASTGIGFFPIIQLIPGRRIDSERLVLLKTIVDHRGDYLPFGFGPESPLGSLRR